MKYKLLLLFLGCCSFLMAAHYRNHGLYLDILLKTTAQTTIYSDKPVRIEQQNLPLNYTLKAPIKISLVHADKEDCYCFMLDSKPADDVDYKLDEDESYRLVYKNYWENGKLEIKPFCQYYDKRVFTTYEEACAVAKKEGRSLKTIDKLSYPNTQVEIRDLSGELYYMELPISISSKAALHLDGEPDGYADFLVLNPAGKNFRIINDVELEEYLMGVVPNEIGDNAPLEALKAQAVAARSETIANLLNNKHFGDQCDLCNTTHCQVYKGGYNRPKKVEEAVLDTAGEILICDSMVVDAVYHSCCGGKTDENQFIWKGKHHPYLESADCEDGVEGFDLTDNEQAREWIDKDVKYTNGSSWESKALRWERTITREQLEKNSGVKSIQSIDIKKRGKSGRIILLDLTNSEGHHLIDGEFKIRQIFGGLPSSFFYLSGESTLRLKGRGAGHGVGMCQVGTLKRARDGMNYQDILHLYFAHSEIYSDWIK